MNLGIVTLYVNDMAREKAFYTDIVGLPVDEENSGPAFVMLQFGSGPLFALESTSILPPGQAHPAGSFEIGLEVEDVDGVYTSWKAKGVNLVSAPSDKPFGREFLARDPEGHYLSVYRLKGN